MAAHIENAKAVEWSNTRKALCGTGIALAITSAIAFAVLMGIDNGRLRPEFKPWAVGSIGLAALGISVTLVTLSDRICAKKVNKAAAKAGVGGEDEAAPVLVDFDAGKEAEKAHNAAVIITSFIKAVAAQKKAEKENNAALKVTSVIRVVAARKKVEKMKTAKKAERAAVDASLTNRAKNAVQAGIQRAWDDVTLKNGFSGFATSGLNWMGAAYTAAFPSHNVATPEVDDYDGDDQ
jgi:hypothetical protein